MLIISKFHDYYDSVLTWGIDKTVVYKREEIEVNLTPVALSYDWQKERPYPYHQSAWRDYTYLSYEASPILVGVGGKVYAGYRIEYRQYNKYSYCSSTVTRYVYSMDDLKSVLKNFDEKALTHFEEGKQEKHSKHLKWCEENVEKFFAEDHTTAQYNVFTNYGVPIFYMTFPVRGADTLTLNKCLKDVTLIRRLDPYTAFQDITMFISGVLGVGEPNTVEISNEEKAKKHGFNKQSFRTDSPGKKANRRSK